jgi:hypothetical protein
MGPLVLEVRGRRPRLRGLRRVGAWDDGTGRLCAVPYESPDGPVIEWPGVAWYRFDESGAVCCWPDPGVSEHVASATFERLRPLILQRLGLEALHASAVLYEGAAVAFCGTSGTGKSTLAHALAQRGHARAADDFLVLDVGERVEALTFPFQPRLRPVSRLHLGAGPEGLTGLAGRVPLSAILLLRRDDVHEPARVTRLEPAAAFHAVLPHAHCYSYDDAGCRRRTIEHYLRIGQRVRVFEVAFAPGFDILPRLVADVERIMEESSVRTVPRS